MAAHHASRLQGTDLPVPHAARLHTDFHSRAGLPSCVTPSLKQSLPVPESQPDVHLLRLLPRIRSRLTLGRRSLPRNPYAFGGADSHRPFRYSCQHSLLYAVHHALQHSFGPHTMLLYQYIMYSVASVLSLSPVYLRRRVTRLVSYYALFKWWLLLSQHPGCLGNPTSFST